MKMSGMQWVVWFLLFVGGLNWGLVGLFKWDLVDTITSGTVTYAENISTFGMIIYLLIGLAAIWSLFTMFMGGSKDDGGSNM